MSKRVLMKGNEVIAESAIRAGLDFFGGYPITPQTELLEYMAKRMPKENRAFIQAESETAAISMVQGASIGGARAMTATSGPGLSLMAEGLNFLAMSRLPCVIVDVQRAASTILPEQSDYNYVTKSLGHNGLRGLVYAPSTLQEAADLTYQAFDKADQYSTPVFLLTDGLMGQMEESVELPEPWSGTRTISYTPPTGCKGREPVTGKNQPMGINGLTPEDALEHGRWECYNMYRGWVDTEVQYEEYLMEDAEYAIIAYGSAARICRDAVKMMRAKGYKVGLFRPITLFPFPEKQIAALKLKAALTVEMALPPMFYEDVCRFLNRDIPHDVYVRCGGNLVDENEACEALLKMIGEAK